jgi:2-succinyl-6-hydroxy-2,4-cyclohexadiene-1-carboxylate synthase
VSATTRFIEACGVRLHVQIEGQGPDVLLLHGFTGSAESMADLSAGLRDRWRTIRVDLVGHGRSDAPRDVACYAMERCLAQLASLLDGLGSRRPHLLGYSMGGRVALALAAAWPQRFASAVLVGASAGIEDPAEGTRRRAADGALADDIERGGVAAFVERWMQHPLFAGQSRLGPGFLERARAQRLGNRAHGLAHSLRGMGTGAQSAVHDRLPGVTIPVLLAVGEEDAKFRGIADALAARLPDARVAPIPDAGHAAHLENAPVFLETVRAFLSSVRSPRPTPWRRHEQRELEERQEL